jgi:hypothetical protein
MAVVPAANASSGGAAGISIKQQSARLLEPEDAGLDAKVRRRTGRALGFRATGVTFPIADC